MKVTGGTMGFDEIDEYRKYIREKHKGCELTAIHIEGDEVVLRFEMVPFERLRRITGYLVGTTDRWNQGKLAELNDRVCHADSKEK